MLSFKDIFKEEFLTDYANTVVDAKHVLLTLALCFLLSLVICGVYNLKSRKTFYSGEFAVALVALSLITAAVIMTIRSSVVVSLGMVGALSIVRFRTAVKAPLDLVFCFWAITVGIICGAGLFYVALLLSVIVAIVVLAADELPAPRQNRILVLYADWPCEEEELTEIVKAHCGRFFVRSRSISGDRLELLLELRMKRTEEPELIRALHKHEGVSYVSLVVQEGKIES